jgi:hypothetical protein
MDTISLVVGELLVIAVIAVLLAIQVIPFWLIFPRLGFDKKLSLLMCIPLVNIITLYVVAFSKPRLPIINQ